eukprot:3688144-Heterocapsa_arctica.AAC.1
MASSSAAGSHGHIITHNRFAELEEARRAEEVFNKAEQYKEERAMENWDQDRRNNVFANRKQQWLVDKLRKEGTHQVGGTRFGKNHMEGSSPLGIEQ